MILSIAICSCCKEIPALPKVQTTFGDLVMAVNGAAAYGMYSHNAALPEIVCTLNRAGFDKENICMVLSPSHPVAAAMRDAKIVNAQPEENAANARTIGWFSEFGAVVIPTVGFFIRSQAFFHDLMVERDFTPLCGESRTLLGLGFSENEAKRLGHQMGDVGALVYVACPEAASAEWAIELLRRTGAKEAAGLQKVKAKAKAAEAAA
jgi:hypothetical protein